MFLILLLLPFSAICQPVKLLKLDWSSQRVQTEILAQLLARQDIKTEVIEDAASAQWFLLRTGRAHVQLEVWEGTMAKEFSHMVEKGFILDAGNHETSTREDWWYPAYVEDLCPGLPDWQALYKCASIFAEQDSGGRGVYHAGPWEKPDRARIRALGIDFVVSEAADGNALNDLIIEHVEARRPLLVFNWSPNWVEARYSGRFVEFPTYHPKCEQDPGWGLNPKYTWDCGNPKNAWLKKAAHFSLSLRADCALALVQAVSFRSNDIAQMAMWVDREHMTETAAALRWLEANAERADNWQSICTSKSLKDGLR
ncbi:ABC transporter substrate-binding protein [Shewanella sp.]|uniref:ABC transporter substrate-binding protein n=1 Tax=Shewanella sp. TaxID=50422 RepID=UPI003563B4CD